MSVTYKTYYMKIFAITIPTFLVVNLDLLFHFPSVKPKIKTFYQQVGGFPKKYLFLVYSESHSFFNSMTNSMDF